MTLLERFVVLMYDRTSEAQTGNEARKQLFTRKSQHTVGKKHWTITHNYRSIKLWLEKGWSAVATDVDNTSRSIQIMFLSNPLWV